MTVFLVLISTLLLAEVPTESESPSFTNLKKILQKDNLVPEVEKKVEAQKKITAQKKQIQKNTYLVPAEEEFWTTFSEYWLVKNVQVLRWDFDKPDYGIEDAFRGFLEEMGHFEKKFRILILDTSAVTHMGLPSNDGDHIFLISLPFIRTLNLSKLEISLLLFEDFLRLRANYFKDFVRTPELKEKLGKSFANQKFDKQILKKVLSNYDQLVFEKGFSFEQQFQITNQIGTILQSNMKLWSAYLQLLKKIDELVKANLLYQNYSKIFPSPELQINWLTPKKGL